MSRLTPFFKNPISRPRAIIWTGVILVALCLSMVVVVGFTSTTWFCSNMCHITEDDAVSAWERSSHSEVSCISCHMPPGADPITFLMHKAAVLPELPMVVFKTFEMPHNARSHVALDPTIMPVAQCTQCHDLSKRAVTTSPGIIINHKAHDDANLTCTICHNRIAHDESGDWEPTLFDFTTNTPSYKHEDFMKMDACYRCHRLADDGIEAETPYKASGKCAVCHPADFDLKPASHKAENFLTDMHGKMSLEEVASVAKSQENLDTHGDESPKDKESPEVKALEGVPYSGVINSCYTCHTKKFCQDCHGGITMPHPADFLTNHQKEAEVAPKSCAKCHGAVETCSRCHHSDPNVAGYKFDTKQTWMAQHDTASKEVGPAACFDCHKPTFCANCHVSINKK